MAADKSFMSEDISSWEQLSYPPDGASPQPVAFVKRNIPYTDKAPNVLQNLTLYIPIFGHNHKTLAALRDADDNDANQPAYWLVYIHGGAWRDPKITAASFDNGAAHVLAPDRKPSSARIAGLASLNYSLSPHPDHPFADSNQSDQRARSATHPQHLHDVLAALALLQSQLRCPNSRLVLAGHSCGATLALQAGAMAALHARLLHPAPAPEPTPSPAAIIGLNGLYDLPALVDRPGAAFAHLQPAYRAFVAGAFGDDERVWALASPAVARQDGGESWVPGWRGGRLLVLAQSAQDELVPRAQMEAQMAAVGCRVDNGGAVEGLEGGAASAVEQRFAGGKTLVVERASRSHHAMWQDGEEMAGIIWRTLDRLGAAADEG